MARRTRSTPLLVALLALLVAAPGTLAAQDLDARRADSTRTAEMPPEADIFRAALQAIRAQHLEEFSDSALWGMALEGLVEGLEDPYAAVLDPEEVEAFEEETTGNYAGIGVAISELDDAITVTAVFRGTPADDAGLQVGDRIVGVNGESTEGWTTSETANRIRGPRGTTVDLRIAREGIGRPFPQTLRRDEVHISAVTASMLEGSVGYVGLDRVARSSAVEVDSALRELRGMEGLIFDLRRNPGGFLDEGIRVADLFLDREEEIAAVRGRKPEWNQSFSARIPVRIPDVPMIVLVDDFSASAAEIIAGALQDHDRALVIGERTFGKGLVQTVVPLPHGFRLRLTTGSWYTPLGRSLHRPRDSEGRLVAEEGDSLPTYTSPAGRTLAGGGGVLPDVVVEADTLSTAEQELFTAAAEAEIPIITRITEAAFEAAGGEEGETGSSPAEVGDETFHAFLDSLVEEGLPERVVWNEEARRHLRWRVNVAMADRRDDFARSLALRMRRDRALSDAVQRLTRADSQAELFASVTEGSTEGSDGSDTTAAVPPDSASSRRP